MLAGMLSAQVTRISGKIYDAATNEPMPFVNVLLVGTKVGTVADVEGNYTIVTEVRADSIRAMYVGFNTTTLPVKSGKTQVINIPMNKSSVQLNEVTIKPGENPAVTLLKKVWEHEPENDRERLDYYQYEVYNKLEFDLNNIPDEFKNSKVMKPVKFIFDNIDTTNPTEKPNLPMFFSESVSDFYYRKNPKVRKEIIKGSKVSGIQDASISQFTGEMYQNINIYDNNIRLFDKLFVSPISNSGVLFYKYYLVDSMTIDGHWCYQIQFKPRRKQELLFVGNVWIADSSFAVKRFEMSITDDANINYVNAFYVIQEFENTSGQWMLTKEKIVADFSMLEKQMGIYGRKTTSYKNIKINQPKDEEFYSKTENLIVEAGAEKRDEEFWKQNRHDSLTGKEQQIYQMVDSVQSLPIYKTWEDIVITLYTGYKVIGPIEYGPWYKTVSYNRIEGVRLRAGGRTSNNFSKWVELSGYVAYGVDDKAFKYSGSFKSFITKKPRQLVGGNYKNDYEILGLSNNTFSSDNIMATLFRRTPLNNMTRVEQYDLWYERDIVTGLNIKTSFVNRNMYPLGGATYMRPTSDSTYAYEPGISTSEFRMNVRWCYDEKYVESVFSRVAVGGYWPVFQLQYTAGLKGVFNSDYSYHKLSLNIDDRVRMIPIGFLNYIVEAGKIWGSVPFPLMVLHPGNQTYVYDGTAYNMMNYYEFASDQYASVILIHHFDGFFLNKIPLMRRLKWREVASFRYLIGSVSDANKNTLLFPNTLFTLNKGPYMEAGVGIENIFRFFRVDVFQRLTYLDHPNVKPIGVRVSMQVLF
ncbi:MAG: DUF5686 and carboxypeptidase-like regulatory domain-containing protein [Bacteroidia bacterium]